jgi:hypothetical protein
MATDPSPTNPYFADEESSPFDENELSAVFRQFATPIHKEAPRSKNADPHDASDPEIIVTFQIESLDTIRRMIRSLINSWSLLDPTEKGLGLKELNATKKEWERIPQQRPDQVKELKEQIKVFLDDSVSGENSGIYPLLVVESELDYCEMMASILAIGDLIMIIDYRTELRVEFLTIHYETVLMPKLF